MSGEISLWGLLLLRQYPFEIATHSGVYVWLDDGWLKPPPLITGLGAESCTIPGCITREGWFVPDLLLPSSHSVCHRTLGFVTPRATFNAW